MKKIAISIILLSLICITVIFGSNAENSTVEYLRIHIRANSNDEEDQAVKYKVKSAVIEYLTPYVSECENKSQTIRLINSKKNSLEEIANKILLQNGFNYKSKVGVKNELFPTRVYENCTLEEGFYDAIIIELGEAKGDNWWCVVYPPLCFTATKNVKYKSKILEIINNFNQKG